MKGYLPAVLLLLFYFTNPLPVAACEQFQAKVERYTKLKRQGGSARQMNRWQAQKREYAERYSECLRALPRVHHASGKPSRQTRMPIERQSRRTITGNNPITQKLLLTCNFWIDTYNRQPSADNKSYRDTACRALDDAEQNPPIATNHSLPQRSVKECIKPGNLLDDDVRECMRGEREPDWL